MTDINEEDLVFCTVKKIEGASVFVEIEGNGFGSIVLSEIAAGRIRNLRQYATPNKKIVCKVLKISKGNIELSLRRVTAKERKQVLDNYKKEKNLFNMLKSISKSPQKILEKIKQKYNLSDFLEEARSNPKIIEMFIPEHEAEKLLKTFLEKKEVLKKVKKTFVLSSTSPSGILEIKETISFPEAKNLKISYLGASKYEIETSASDFRQAEQNLEIALEKIQRIAKQKQMFFATNDKK